MSGLKVWLTILEEKVVETKKNLGDTVSSLTEKGKEVLGNQVVKADTYLKDSFLATPLNKVLEVTEKVADLYLPGSENPKEEVEVTGTENQGPVLKAGVLSKKIQKNALLKMKNLKIEMRSAESVKKMEYVVDLIKYAQTNLDNSVQATKAYLEEEKNKLQQVKLEDVSKSIQKSTSYAISSISAVVNEMSKQAIALPQKTYQTVSEKAEKVRVQINSATEASTFLAVASNNVAKLNEVVTLLASQGSAVSQSVMAQASQTLNTILSSLIATGKPQPSKTQSTSEEEESDSEEETK